MNHLNLIKTSGTIVINKNPEVVFNFFAHPNNDHLWRKEINKTIIDNTLQVGVTINEYSHLSKRVPDNKLELKCVKYEINKIAVFETNENSRFYLKSERMVKALSENSTEVTYNLCFDKNIVKFALGFNLPTFIISMKANSDMNKYLKQLKKLIATIP